ncbi:MAG: OmpA family protein [Chitinophagales bacterium]
MKALATISLFSLFSYSTYSQNLVVNPGFEIYIDSNVVTYHYHSVFYGSLYLDANLSNCLGWSPATRGTPDLLSFNHTKFSHSGYSLAQASISGSHWEYPQGKLISALEADKKYLVQFWVAAKIGSKSLPASVGIRFTNDEQNIFGDNCLNTPPDIEWGEKDLPTQTNTWVLLSDTLTAQGGEQFFHIGNFKPQRETKMIMLDRKGKGVSLLLIDDVLVEPLIPTAKEDGLENMDKLSTGETFNLENIYFEKASYRLKDESIPELNMIKNWLHNKADVKILIEGHTDDDGNSAYNLELSINRANEVKQYLTNNGIDSDRIQVKGYGASRPFSEDSTEPGKKLNRRIELRIIE